MNIPTLMPGHKPSQPTSEKDISIIIAHRGPEMGLWLTIQGCEIDLQRTNLTREYIVVVNGEPELSSDLKRQKHFMGHTDLLRDFIHVAEPMSPPSARQLGTESATGKYYFFFDNHCLVDRGYFQRAIESMQKHDMGMLHSTTKFWEGEEKYYEYHLTLKRDFWTQYPYKNEKSLIEPWQIGVAGHGGFAVPAKVWKEVGGYWQGFDGYGGEESYFDLKLGLLGYTNWIDPQVLHYHWSGARTQAVACAKCGHKNNTGYLRHFTDDYFRNMMMCANIIGGEKWMFTVYKSFTKFFRLGEKPTPMFDLYRQASDKSAQHAQEIAAKRVMTLDELLADYAARGIRT